MKGSHSRRSTEAHWWSGDDAPASSVDLHRLPVRVRQVDVELATIGTGADEDLALGSVDDRAGFR